jgi:hypothetical protein
MWEENDASLDWFLNSFQRQLQGATAVDHDRSRGIGQMLQSKLYSAVIQAAKNCCILVSVT